MINKTLRNLIIVLLLIASFGCKSQSDQIPAHLLLWHSFETGSAEEMILSTLVGNANENHPNWEIEIASIPYDQINQKYQAAVKAGGGPDLYLDRNDQLGEMVSNHVIADLTNFLEGKLSQVTENGVKGMTVDGKIYGIPLSSMTDVLFYNKTYVPEPPRTTDDLLEMVNSGLKVILSPTAYHLFAWHGAFGGAWLDNSGKCIPDEGGWMEASNFLLALKDAGAIFSQDFASAEAAFTNGQTAFLINGPWALRSYKTSLGQNLGAVPIPSGTLSSQPFMGLEGFYVNPNTKNPEAAIELGLILSDKESQKLLMDFAGYIPVRTDVQITDPLIQAFVIADRTAILIPQNAGFKKFWSPFNLMWQKILFENADFSDAYKEACLQMNNENN